MFKLPDLPYAYNALEPYIDEATMRVHHLGHHQGYTNGLNAAIEGTPFAGKSIEEILGSISPGDTAIRNNGGGYWNHLLYWQIMSPNGGGEPSGALKKAIDKHFGSFADFRAAFKKAGLGRFGSGWAWLMKDGDRLYVCSTPNQDNPLMKFVDCPGTPILGMDVWEHAYYLKHQNKRGNYIDDFFNVIHWAEVEKRFNEA